MTDVDDIQEEIDRLRNKNLKSSSDIKEINRLKKKLQRCRQQMWEKNWEKDKNYLARHDRTEEKKEQDKKKERSSKQMMRNSGHDVILLANHPVSRISLP